MAAPVALDRWVPGWDLGDVPALTLRPAPLDRVAALRALPAVVVALAGGAWLALVVAVIFGGDMGSAETLWIGVAGGCACASGAIVASTGNVTWPAGLAIVAVAAVVLAASGGEETQRVTRFERADVVPAIDTPAAKRDRAAAPARSRDKATAEARAAGGETRPQAGGQTTAAGGEAPAAVLSVSAATKLVGSYYGALDAGDFEAAWARLTPSVQAAFGGFDHWRSGYETTVRQRVADVEVDGAEIRHALVATDRTPCGTTVEQRFRVTWNMAGNRAESLHAVKLAGEDPAAVC
jgi:hypothetical protein